MLNRDDWIRRVQEGLYLFDGAMGTNLMAAGMPRGCCGTTPAHIRLLKNRLTRMRSITIM